jgi:hypothetical protein
MAQRVTLQGRYQAAKPQSIGNSGSRFAVGSSDLDTATCLNSLRVNLSSQDQAQRR